MTDDKAVVCIGCTEDCFVARIEGVHESLENEAFVRDAFAIKHGAGYTCPYCGSPLSASAASNDTHDIQS